MASSAAVSRHAGSFAASDPALWRGLAELHQLDRVAVRIGQPRLPVVVEAEARLTVDRDALAGQRGDVGVEVVTDEAEVHEAPTLHRRLGTIREQLQKPIAAQMEVHEHQRAVRVMQPERLVDAEGGVELERPLEVVDAERGMAEVGEHALPLDADAADEHVLHVDVLVDPDGAALAAVARTPSCRRTGRSRR